MPETKNQDNNQVTPTKEIKEDNNKNRNNENIKTNETNASTPKTSSSSSSLHKHSSEFTLDKEQNENSITSINKNNSTTIPDNATFSLNKNNCHMAQGTIELIMGPMFSGKSTELLRKIRRYSYQKRSTVVVSYIFDTRYSKSEELISTHDKTHYPAIKTGQLKTIKDKLYDYDVIGVDEGQFYPDLIEVVEELANIGKTVIISCLSGNFKREPFEAVTKLIPKCEKIQLLTAICSSCGCEATYTFRTIRNEDEVLIGGEESYKPACRLCYMKNTCSDSSEC